MYFTGTLYWITLVMARLRRPADVDRRRSLNGALIAYLALFPALFAVVMRRALAAFGARALAAAPLVWVATELGRTYILTGFPWVLLGYSQADVLPIAQLASVFGVYGVSALVAAVSAAAANVGRRGAGRSSSTGVRRRGLLLIVGVLGRPSASTRRSGRERASRFESGSCREMSIRARNGIRRARRSSSPTISR